MVNLLKFRNRGLLRAELLGARNGTKDSCNLLFLASSYTLLVLATVLAAPAALATSNLAAVGKAPGSLY